MYGSNLMKPMTEESKEDIVVVEMVVVLMNVMMAWSVK